MKKWIPPLKIAVAAALFAFLIWLVPFKDRLVLVGDGGERTLTGELLDFQVNPVHFECEQGVLEATLAADGFDVGAVKWPDGRVESFVAAADSIAPRSHLQPGLITVVQHADLRLLLLAMSMILVASIVAAYRWDLLLAGAGLPTGFGRAFSLTFIGAFFNNVMPGLTGGDIVKAIYIAREHRSQKTAAIITVLLDRLLGITGLALVAGLVIPLDFARYRLVAVWIYGLLAVVIVIGVVFFSKRVRAALRFDQLLAKLPAKELLKKADSAVFIYRYRMGLVGVSLVLSMVVHTILIGAFALIGRGIGIDLALASYFALIPIALIVSALPIAPSGWGVGEAASVFFLGTVGVPSAMALTLFLVYRMEQMAVSLIGGVCLAIQKDKVSSAEVEHFAEE